VKRAIVLIDHGSRRAEANAQLETVAAEVRQRCPDDVVACAHMELAEPDLAQAVAACIESGAREIVVHPYFLGPGRHTQEDIPRMVEQIAREHPEVAIRVSDPLGVHPGVIDAVLDRVSRAR
jgi:sirohydrochlorin ferrochelatase